MPIPPPNKGHKALRKGRFSEAGRPYLVTTVTHDRTPFFRNFTIGRLVVGEMRRLHEEEWIGSLAWVLMPDHLHWLFDLGEGRELAGVMKALKGRSGQTVNRHLGRAGPVWDAAYHDHALRKEEDIRGVARYSVGNPLRAGLVQRIGDYPLWDAVWLP